MNCPRCQGTGTIKVLSYKDRYQDVWTDETCPVCVGKGHREEHKPRTLPIWWPRAMGIDDYIDARERRMRRHEYPEGDPLLY